MTTPILKQGPFLVATVQPMQTDAQWCELEEKLLDQIGRYRSRGVIVDVTALDVLDSFATRILRSMADAARLRGAEAVFVGIQPEVALTMVQLGLTFRLQGIATALDLEEGMALLTRELHI